MVLIDLRYLQYYPNGLSVFTWNILKHLLEKSKQLDYDIILLLKSNDKFTDDIKSMIYDNHKVKLVTKTTLSSNLYFTKFKKVDLYLSFHYTLPLNLASGIGVTIIHDLMPLEDTNYINGNWITKQIKKIIYKYQIKRTLSKSKTIFTPSLYSKNKIIEFFGAQDKIKLLTPGIEDDFLTKHYENEIAVKSKLKFIYVGENRPHKNISLFLDIFKEIKKIEEKSEFIICGRNWKSIDQEGVFVKGEITTEQKINFIKESTYIVLISKYEGYGIPLDEAHALGTPAIISNLNVFEERKSIVDIVINPKEEARHTAIKIIKQYRKQSKNKIPSNLDPELRSWKSVTQKVLNEFQS